ncbi:hypothetical protein [Rothia aerolata]|uniref:Lipoprotein n=1 Tax=Rothia aerolata TaxID=1812262 RepID=A0A917ILJ9_9MICC|nr:hypothetical protein [Rothia aerolata]GGH58036.1 hypothetical protein GCM10007359_03790 [Rothia aerolata]
MASKKVLAALALGSAALLSGCATTIVDGLGIEKTTNFEDNRDNVVVEAYVLDVETGEPKAATVTFEQDQMPFEGNRVEIGAEETYLKVTADNTDDLAGHRLTAVVSSDNPDDTAVCAIKDSGIFEPVHSAHAEAKGSATCQIEMH